MSVKITMIGTGYVGLVTGACFAEIGHSVICVDKDAKKIKGIQNGVLPIYEPGLDELIERNVARGSISFSTDLAESVRDREAIFIAVGTPSDDGGRADLKYVYAAAAEIAQALTDFTVVITKSTVPVGTNRQIAEKISKRISSDASFAVASNPEFLREGAAINDFMEPDRIVLGCDDEQALDIARRIYAPLTSRGYMLMEHEINTAEMVKYAANAFLAVKVSFINEVADLCEQVGADVNKVAAGIGEDQRIGRAFLRVGPGWGGSCFPKDTRALQTTATDHGLDMSIVRAAIESNVARKRSMADRITAVCGGDVAGKKIAVLGLTFKGQTDDMRESPTLDFLPPLIELGADVHAFDPSNPAEAPQLLPDLTLDETPQDVVENADILVVATDWGVFSTYDLKDLASRMKTPAMLDLRNLFSRADVLEKGFETYVALGTTA